MAKKTRRSTAARAPRPGRPGGPAKRLGLTANPKASTLAGRLRAAAGPLTFREIGEMTGTHPENARRYLQGGSVGLKFLQSFCNAFNVRADWLLEGIEPRNRTKGR